MGLFRRGRRKHEKAAANLVAEQAAVTAPVSADPAGVTAGTPQAPADPAGATAGTPQAPADSAAATAGTAQAKAVRREVTAEARPDPDRPGWGRIIGQSIGKPREDREE